MQRGRDSQPDRTGDKRRTEFTSLASQALAVLAARAPACGEAPDRAELDLLERAAFEQDRTVRLSILDTLQAHGVSDEAIVDLYIPALARRLGEDWCDDRRSFAEVTIAVARLQSMLHDIAVDWAQERLGEPDAPEVLIVVLDQEYHTLGALVAATRFRRLGAATRIALGVTEGEILAEALYSRADLVAISASAGENLDSIGKLVEKLHARQRPPVVAVGGSVLESRDDVRDRTGADIVTSDPGKALEICELRRSRDGRTKADGRRPPQLAPSP